VSNRNASFDPACRSIRLKDRHIIVSAKGEKLAAMSSCRIFTARKGERHAGNRRLAE
jgi:hypothetical protein